MSCLIEVYNIEEAEFVLFKSLFGISKDNKQLGISINKFYEIQFDENEEFYFISDYNKRIYEFEVFGKVYYSKTKGFKRDIKEVENRKWYLKIVENYKELKPYIYELDIGLPKELIEESYKTKYLELMFLDVEFARLGIELAKEGCPPIVKPLIEERRKEIVEARLKLIFS